MNDLPPPYSLPPPPDFNLPLADGLAPARRASTIMFVLCGIFLAMGVMAFLASAIPEDQIPPQQRPQIDQIVAQSGHPFKTVARVFGWTMTVPALVMGTLGFLVRGGRPWAIRAAMFFCGLILMILATQFVMTLMHHEGDLSSILPFLGLGALIFYLLSQLSNAAKAGRQARLTAKQYWNQGQDEEDY